MSVRKRLRQRGATLIRTILTIVIALITLYGAYRLVRWLWHVWVHMSAGARSFWHLQMADPAFRGILHATSIFHGNVFLGIGLTALAFWVYIRITGGISITAMRTAEDKRQAVMENVVSRMENIQDKLKKLFADDLEKIALFSGTSGKRALTVESQTARTGSTGCLFGILWVLIAFPINVLLGVAIFDGILRLFVISEPRQLLLASAGSRVGEFIALWPLPRTASFAGIFQVHLDQRSIPLALVIFVLGFCCWLTMNTSKTGWTLPKMQGKAPMITFLCLVLLAYAFLKSAVLIFAAWMLFFSLCYQLLSRFFLGQIMLRVRAVVRRQAVQRPLRDVP